MRLPGFTTAPAVRLAALSGVLVVVVAGIAVGASARPTAAGGRTSIQCQSLQIPVALGPAAPADQAISATLCAPAASSGTLQILLHCATCSYLYWDFPFQSEQYSYVQAMNRAGYATLNLDRLGIGASSHPDPDALTGDSEAYVVHQLVQMARSGVLGGRSFDHVVLVGSSIGSVFSLIESATYGDVDGLVLSSFVGHGDPDPIAAAYFVAHYFAPAATIDPRFAGLPAGYLTTQPSTIAPFFFYVPGADPRVIALDEATRETVTQSELDAIATSLGPAIDTAIRVPVLLSDGEFDWIDGCTLSCGQPGSPPPPPVNLEAEPGYFPNAPSFQVFVQPQAGHAQNLHRTAPAFYAAVRDWLAEHGFRSDRSKVPVKSVRPFVCATTCARASVRPQAKSSTS